MLLTLHFVSGSPQKIFSRTINTTGVGLSSSNINYTALVNAAPPKAPINTTLLWAGTGATSNTSDVAHRLSTSLPSKYVTLESTLLGHAVNGLNWCPSNQQNCIYSFWDVASAAFARNIEGAWSVLLYGGNGDAYRQNSTLGRFEIPNINASKITSITVMVIPTDHDSCTLGSILTLKSLINER